MLNRTFSLKHQLGACIFDLPRFLWATKPQFFRRTQTENWVFNRNRDERLITGPQGLGVQCDWQWTSDLYIAQVFPFLGRVLMKRALRDYPIMFQTVPNTQDRPIDVTFIIGHRGLQRLPHLLLTLQSIAAQRAASVECIVVEQSPAPEIKDQLPPWVRYIHTPLAWADMPYCRAWAFNVGARLASGELLILHDNDMLVPRDYASNHLSLAKKGCEVISLKRFIFFLNEMHTRKLLRNSEFLLDQAPASIMQNAEGGGSIAISRDAYLSVGGFDESFIGWGGEDNEFWDRAQTRRVWPYGYLPLVHLWHSAQPEKIEKERVNHRLLASRSAIPVTERIAELTARDFGSTQSPFVDFRPAKSYPSLSASLVEELSR